MDTETGRVYVVDSTNNRINVFQLQEEGKSAKFEFAFGWGVLNGANVLQTCTTASGCLKGLAGSGAGQLNKPRSITVDNNPGGASQHAVYVGVESLRVQKFDSAGNFLLSFASQGECQINRNSDQVAVGPGGVVYLADSEEGPEGFVPRVERFSEAGVCLGAAPLAHKGLLNQGWAVDSGGNTYGSYNEGGGVFKFKPDGSDFGSPYPLDPGLFAIKATVGAGDEFFITQGESSLGPSVPNYGVITKFSSSGTKLRRYGYGTVNGFQGGAAAHSTAGGDVVVSEQSGEVKYAKEPPAGSLIAPPGLVVASAGNAKATLNAEINPEGKATTYHFEYVDQASFEATGFAGATSTATKPVEMPGGTEFSLHLVSAEVGCPNPLVEAEEPGKCLVPSTQYRFRVIAGNADGAGNSPVEGSFTTKPPLEINSPWATEVGPDSAVIHGEANPLDIPTSGYFEYVDDATYQDSGFADANRVPGSGEIDFGSGSGFTSRSASLGPLQPGTTYHYRFLATDPLIPEPLVSAERTFTTFPLPSGNVEDCPQNESFRIGLSALLPDCRAYEMVSPLDKESGDIIALKEFDFLPGVLNQSSTSGEKFAYGSYRAFGNAQSAPFTSQYIAARSADGWSSHGISPPRTHLAIPTGRQLDTELKVLSPDLCQGWYRTVADPVLAPGGVAGFANIYRRLDSECGGVSYQALTTVAPPNINRELYFELELQGVSADGQAAIFVAPDNLTPDTAPQPPACVNEGVQCQLRLYLHTAEGLRSVCTLPDAEPSEGPCQAGGPMGLEGFAGNFQNAISDDGSRVFWTDALSSPGKIYLRENPGQEQSAISGGECTEPAKACTFPVSQEAEEISSTTSSQFWAAADDGSSAFFTSGSTLFEYDVAEGKANPIAGKVFGAPGVSENGEWIYLVSEEVKSGVNSESKSPTAGKPNLYRYHSGSFAFVATLSAADAKALLQKGESSPVAAQPSKRTLRVGADGQHVVFMSTASLTGYDNLDAASDKADAEVFLYDAEANGGNGKLLCVSCNPTGSRPAGSDVSKQLGPDFKEFWAAAQIPFLENALYGARVLSTDGSRLFFESTDTLSPGDTNGRQDVYEWEVPGTGGCDEEDVDFYASNGGCIRLISSGESGRDAEFLDASPDGSDVFIATLSSLLPQDYGLVDVYDARVEGGFPSPPPPEVECEGETCQSPAPAPQASTPASEAFQGRGNLHEATRKKCGKGKVLRQGRCVKKGKKGKAKHKKQKQKSHGRAGR